MGVFLGTETDWGMLHNNASVSPGAKDLRDGVGGG